MILYFLLCIKIWEFLFFLITICQKQVSSAKCTIETSLIETSLLFFPKQNLLKQNTWPSPTFFYPIYLPLKWINKQKQTTKRHWCTTCDPHSYTKSPSLLQHPSFQHNPKHNPAIGNRFKKSTNFFPLEGW